jgi:hypothetical protein
MSSRATATRLPPAPRHQAQYPLPDPAPVQQQHERDEQREEQPTDHVDQRADRREQAREELTARLSRGEPAAQRAQPLLVHGHSGRPQPGQDLVDALRQGAAHVRQLGGDDDAEGGDDRADGGQEGEEHGGPAHPGGHAGAVQPPGERLQERRQQQRAGERRGEEEHAAEGQPE